MSEQEQVEALTEALRGAVCVGHIGPNSREIIERGGAVFFRAIVAAARAEAWDEGRQTFFGRNPYRPHRAGCGVCVACNPGFRGMYLCATCGNKRCPATTDCQKWECSGSNETDQIPTPRADRETS